MMDSVSLHLEAIRELFDAAEGRGLPLWLESGWAIDARLGRVTREHGDLDVAFPGEREADYLDLLRSLGYGPPEFTDYGFLCWQGELLLDSEPCRESGGGYGFAGFPAGACPLAKEGNLRGYAVRCVSWEAMYFESLGCLRDIPLGEWREKDHEGLRFIEAHLTEQARGWLRELHERGA